MRVRDATPDDARAVAEVHVRTWQAAYRGLVPDDYLDRLSVERRETGWRDTLSAELPEVFTLVAEADGRVVGFAGGGPSRDEDVDDTTGELYAIYALPEWWGTEVGAALLEDAITRLRTGYARATLWVLAGNARARRFYEKAGWRADGTTKDDDRWGDFVLREVRYRAEL